MVPKAGLDRRLPGWCHYICVSVVLSNGLYLAMLDGVALCRQVCRQ
jgi:hypothetical protein